MAGFAFVADATRSYLARLMRMDGASELRYAVTIACIAMVSVGTALLVIRLAQSDRTLIVAGLVAAASGASAWAAAPHVHPSLWVIDNVFLGASVAVTPRGDHNASMAADQQRVARRLANVMTTRTAVAAGGTVALGPGIAVFGSTAFVLPSVAALGVAVGILARVRYASQPRSLEGQVGADVQV